MSWQKIATPSAVTVAAVAAVAAAIATAIAMTIAIPLNPDTIIEIWYRLVQDDDNNIKLEQEYEVHHCFVH